LFRDFHGDLIEEKRNSPVARSVRLRRATTVSTGGAEVDHFKSSGAEKGH
jgi:hypothetical protein